MTTDHQQSDCLFCKIADKVLSAHLIFENKEHIAFLTPFPNTPGFSVVMPKRHHPSYGFAVPENILLELIKTALVLRLHLRIATPSMVEYLNYLLNIPKNYHNTILEG